jgi:mRNA interferase RelE/StbE
MTAWKVELSSEATKNLRRIRDAGLHDRLVAAIAALAGNPRPPGCLKLAGEVDQRRVRVGDWRIVQAVADGRLPVLAVRVAPRGGVYG